MDFKQTCRIVEQSFHELSPQSIVCRPGDSDDSLVVTIVSPQFHGLTIKARFNKVWDILTTIQPTLISEIMFSFELWTAAEFQNLPTQNQTDQSIDSDNDSAEEVASPI